MEATKTVLLDGEQAWVMSDAIYAFDSNGQRFLSANAGASGKKSHSFHFENWPDGSVPAYCLFNNSAKGIPWAEARISEGAIVAKIPDVQEITLLDSYAYYAPVLAGAVCPSPSGDGTFVTNLKSVFGLVKINIGQTEGISSITIKGRKGEILSGTIAISSSSLDSGNPEFTILEGVDSVCIKVSGEAASENGCFMAKDDDIPVSYYATVLSGTSFWPTITFTDFSGRRATKKFRETVSIAGGKVIELANIDNDLSFDPKPFVPDSLIFTIGSKWVFNESIVPRGEQSGSGETYTYHYSDPAHNYEADYSFVLCKGNP
ncbi:MAG: hypothetical protein GX825_04195, partial [Syntrophomonadaceae bacterium]|nr:hypothetical protein [Syntrophomonadaceae bacterium]